MASLQCHKPSEQATPLRQGGYNNQQTFGQKVKEMATGMFKGMKEHKHDHSNQAATANKQTNCFGHFHRPQDSACKPNKAEHKTEDKSKKNKERKGHGSYGGSSSDSGSDAEGRNRKKK